MSKVSFKMHQIQFSAGAPPVLLAGFGENGRENR